MSEHLPLALKQALTVSTEPDAVFSALMPALAEFLQCDRCFLYLRDPLTKWGRVPYCWVRNANIPEIFDQEWQPEPDSLPQDDPLFAAALRTAPSIFVEDVEAAAPDVLNREFERKSFGHRALVHAHLCQRDRLWGVLQPCVFGQPRVWTETNRAVINQVTERITPLAILYVNAAFKRADY